ncbi:hypothetical protein [Spirabiliibacterium falconis]|uniref:hypothetical protein n=1 Tax=Spirabiliibacterium falconis TaxID=572023 RepID=UPI001AACEC5B|nr:hypothetical protein [Spirabiliibacterium falconis]MBE2893628.1 hypothetical protein [Spirabiliibacterium falconis]
MKKAITLGLTTLLLTGCGSNFMNYSSTPKYRVTDQEIEQALKLYFGRLGCQYPQLQGQTYADANKLMNKLVTKEIDKHMRDLILSVSFGDALGRSNYTILMSDPYSQQYLVNKFGNKLNSKERIVLAGKKSECESVRKNWKKQKQQELVKKRQAEKEALARKRQAEKEEKARQAFYSTPQGQAYLAQQRMMAQQQAMQQRAIAQRNAELEAQRRYAEMQALNNSMAELNNTIQRTNQNNMNMYNQMNQYNQMQQMNRSLNNINNSLQNMGGGSGIRWNNVY